MMFYLTILEMIISMYWLTNIILFKEISILKEYNNCKKCIFSSFFAIFFQNLDWMIFICTLYNLLKFFEDPAHERNGYPNKKFLYFIFSIGVSVMFTWFVYIADLYGISVILYQSYFFFPEG